MKEYSFLETTNEMSDFISKSPSAFHVVDNFEGILQDEGFVKLMENEVWNLTAGGKYYVTRGDSSLIAFRLPGKSKKFSNYQIAAAHSDSPTFKLKENPEMVVDNSYVCLNVEKYGGMLMAPWLDRPLSIAGRVLVKEGNSIRKKLVNVDRDLCLIPNLAIHMNREANDGYKYNPQTDMLPLIGSYNSKEMLGKIIADATEVDIEDIIASDLFLYNRQSPVIWGADNEFISAPRLDDLMCAYGCMNALIISDGDNNESVTVCSIFDNEEVGSTTKQGADSTLLADVLERIAIACQMSVEEYKIALSDSFMISADNAHALHPNHVGKSDPTNKVYMNEGIVIKYNANQKYSTDAVSSAIFKEICKRADIPTQSFVNRSDIAGGSTLGNISNSHISINTVDIGLATLAMHSPFETAGIKDVCYLINAVKEFFETAINTNMNESYSLER